MLSSRRQFLATLGRTAAVATLGPAASAASLLRPEGSRRPGGPLAVLGADRETDYGRGVLLGMEEARHAAGLLRAPLELVSLPAAAAAGERLPAGVAGIVAALQEHGQRELEGIAADRGLVLVDGRAVFEEAEARPGVFRVGLPRAAYAQAESSVGPGSPGRAVLWHEGLFRYGAEQLNERFRRRFAVGMTGEAWAGWMAVKALTEAALRAATPGAAGIRDALAGPRAAFDGHKGAPLAFTAPGRTLAQPFYILRAGTTEQVRWPMEGAG